MITQEESFYKYTPERFLADMDRCEHGRHHTEDCFGCPDGNLGNPRMRGEDPRLETGEQILAYGVGGYWCYILLKPENHVWGTHAIKLVKNPTPEYDNV